MQTCKRKSSDFLESGTPTIINLQPGRDGKAKPYQARQVRAVIVTNNL
jgi:hypothetical protein